MAVGIPAPHVFPYKGRFVIFNPANQAVVLLDGNAVNVIRHAQRDRSLEYKFPAVFSELDRAGIDAFSLLNDARPIAEVEETVGVFSPTDVALFPTHDCSLRCVYCYAGAGVHHVTMSKDVAEAAVEFVMRNSTRSGIRKTHVAFHGGGEPFYGRAWHLMRHVVQHATGLGKQLGVDVSFYASTNGVLSRRQLDWIVASNLRLQLSFDGPPDIQNANRPTASGKGSFEPAMRTMEFLEKAEHPYSIRATITDRSVNRLCELVDFFGSVSSVTDLHFEALHECGRCSDTGAKPPPPSDFVEKMIEAQAYALTVGRTVWFSQFRLESRDVYCGALAPMFCVTPEGMVSSCYEVSSQSDPRSETFFYGRYDEAAADKFVFDEVRIKRLKGRTADRIAGCETCFARQSCAGDCPAKKGGDIYSVSCSDDRCEMTKTYLFKQILSVADRLEQRGHSDVAV